jgi:hypothetical protein
MPGLDFTAAHHVVDGVSRARPDAAMTLHRTERGSIDSLTLDLGGELHIEFEQQGSYDWPIHTYGTKARVSRDKTVARSWCYMENMPLNWGLVEEYQLVSARLKGRYPSLQRVLEGASVVDGRIVYAGAGDAGK